VASQWIQEFGASQPEMMEARITEALRANFKPEFLNRIDEIIIFHGLTREQISEIVDIQIKRLSKRLDDIRLELVLSDDARAFLAEKGFDPVYGARPLKRAIQKYIENPLSMAILEGTIQQNGRIRAEVDHDQIVFRSI